MPSKKILFLSLLIALGVGLFYFTHWYREYRQTNFSYKNSHISAIELVFKSDTLRLTKSNGHWFINDFFIADSIAVGNFIDILQSISSLAPATLKTGDNLHQLFQAKGIGVRIYSGKRLGKEYRIASIAEFNYKPVALKSGSEVPYYVDSPNAVNDLIDYYSVNPDKWLAGKLFTEPVEAIEKIKAVFPDKEKGYTLELGGNQIALFNSAGDRVSNINLANISNLYYSFDNFRLLYPTNAEVNSAIPENLIASIHLKMLSGKAYEYNFYRITGKEFNNILGQELHYNPNRLLVKLSENQFLVGTYLHFHYVLCPIDVYVNN
jgi:hypothetical protein